MRCGAGWNGGKINGKVLGIVQKRRSLPTEIQSEVMENQRGGILGHLTWHKSCRSNIIEEKKSKARETEEDLDLA